MDYLELINYYSDKWNYISEKFAGKDMLYSWLQAEKILFEACLLRP